MVRKIMMMIAAVMLVVLPAVNASAASPIYMKNHSSSVATISISTTNPATSGHIFAVKPGYAGTGLCFYASASKLTMYWLGNGTAKAAKAGAWNCPPYSNLQYTIRVFN